MIYFVKPVGADGPVKVGYTCRAIKHRLKGLQTGSPVKLEVLATFKGTQANEAQIHQHLRTSRLHGEWFERNAFMDNLLDDLAAGKIEWDTFTPAPAKPAMLSRDERAVVREQWRLRDVALFQAQMQKKREALEADRKIRLEKAERWFKSDNTNA